MIAEMDQAADAMRESGAHVRRHDLQLVFREIQQAHMPHLSREQWLELFELWLERDLARLQTERRRTLNAILDAIESAAKANGPGKIRCVCGAVLKDPGDPATMAEHAPHVATIAGLRRLAR
ncbi:hypothetical protein [Bradyrhizobium sp. CCGUVB23]|uniref:hypothetical protein n=1 Tax=Bradyrhizobium sp. CCGUVB23 TaxID=2949630 RepID=UPI0020B33F75|nr:hypothetical protein [Bradyrhizobium sp. CCGUVB23]MCP3462532.1 hypothetical protein [Bradyrhizobium sp. CCGUVB23]